MSPGLLVMFVFTQLTFLQINPFIKKYDIAGLGCELYFFALYSWKQIILLNILKIFIHVPPKTALNIINQINAQPILGM